MKTDLFLSMEAKSSVWMECIKKHPPSQF